MVTVLTAPIVVSISELKILKSAASEFVNATPTEMEHWRAGARYMWVWSTGAWNMWFVQISRVRSSASARPSHKRATSELEGCHLAVCHVFDGDAQHELQESAERR